MVESATCSNMEVLTQNDPMYNCRKLGYPVYVHIHNMFVIFKWQRVQFDYFIIQDYYNRFQFFTFLLLLYILRKLFFECVFFCYINENDHVIYKQNYIQ